MRHVKSAPNLSSLAEAASSSKGSLLPLPLSNSSGSLSGQSYRMKGLSGPSKGTLSTTHACGTEPRMKPCRSALSDVPAGMIAEMELALSSKGLMGAECVLRFETMEATQPLAASHSAPDLRAVPPTQRRAASAATSAVAHANEDAESSLAACLATPAMEEESMRSMLDEELRRVASENEAKLQLRFMREMRRSSTREEEEEPVSVTLSSEKRKRKAQFLLEEMAPGLFGGDSDDEGIMMNRRTNVGEEVSSIDAAQHLLVADDSTKNKLHLERVVSSVSEVVAGHEMTEPCKSVFECTVDDEGNGVCRIVDWATEEEGVAGLALGFASGPAGVSTANAAAEMDVVRPAPQEA